jgi:hypothetical protein
MYNHHHHNANQPCQQASESSFVDKQKEVDGGNYESMQQREP